MSLLNTIMSLAQRHAQLKALNVDPDGWTPLHHAVESDSAEEVIELLEKGADVNAKNKYGSTPLHLAARSGFIGVARVLLQYGADDSIKNKYSFTAREYADVESRKETEIYLTKVKLLTFFCYLHRLPTDLVREFRTYLS